MANANEEIRPGQYPALEKAGLLKFLTKEEMRIRADRWATRKKHINTELEQMGWPLSYKNVFRVVFYALKESWQLGHQGILSKVEANLIPLEEMKAILKGLDQIRKENLLPPASYELIEREITDGAIEDGSPTNVGVLGIAIKRLEMAVEAAVEKAGTPSAPGAEEPPEGKGLEQHSPITKPLTPQGKLSVDDKALGVFASHQTWTNKQIAQEVGCNSTTLSNPKKCPQFCTARKVQKKANKNRFPRGSKYPNEKLQGEYLPDTTPPDDE